MSRSVQRTLRAFIGTWMNFFTCPAERRMARPARHPTLTLKKMPHRLTLTRMCEMVRARKLSPVELMDAHLKQIVRVNPHVNAFISVLEEEAREAAQRAQDSESAGPLHGIPVTIKDSF